VSDTAPFDSALTGLAQDASIRLADARQSLMAKPISGSWLAMSEGAQRPIEMEAAGFAPASEHTSPQDSTMRIRLCIVVPDVKRRNNRRAPTPGDLASRRPRQPPVASLLK
jgi:hypothetical protein